MIIKLIIQIKLFHLINTFNNSNKQLDNNNNTITSQNQKENQFDTNNMNIPFNN